MSYTYAQAGLACNDLVQITLEDDCTILVKLDHILEGQQYPDAQYSLTLVRPDGTIVTGNLAGQSEIGLLLTARVLHLTSGIECWGNVSIEEKQPPIFTNCVNGVLPGMIIECDEESNPDPSDYPVATDGCAGNVAITFYDEKEEDAVCSLDQAVFNNFGGIENNGNASGLWGDEDNGGNGTASENVLRNILTIEGSTTTNVETEYCITFAKAGYVIFGWDYDSDDDFASTDPFGYSINSTDVQLTSGLSGTSTGSARQSDFEIVHVDIGDVFCFVQDTDGDGDNATTVINDFSFRPELYVGSITRTWVATDGAGNSSTCVQNVLIKQGSIINVVCPPSWTQDPMDASSNYPYFECSDSRLGADAPPVSLTGEPTGISCRNIQSHYSDQWFPSCGNSGKWLRSWTILDWCTGEEVICEQVIKIVDSTPPIIAKRLDEFEIYTTPGSCEASFEVPIETDIIECGAYDVEVGYIVKNDGADRDPSFGDYSTDKVVGPDANGKFFIYNLEIPQDSIWLAYRFTDKCGFATESFNEAILVDNQPPTPVCETHTIVSLDNIGWAEAMAEVFDDHSYDNCGIEKFEVRRVDHVCPGYNTDFTFGPKVNFCCEDLSRNPIQVELRVYDEDGNYNECLVHVTVQDQFAPAITNCPDDVTIFCEQDINDLSLTGGEPTVRANCTATLTHRDTEFLNDCGIGYVSRRWTVTNATGQSTSCSQEIYVQMRNTFDFNDITWPPTATINGCTDADADPMDTGEPTYTNVDCLNITSGYSDEIGYTEHESCGLIIRTWTVIDWCQYDVDGNTERGKWTNIQKIKLNDTEKPTFIIDCTDRVIETSGSNCEAFVELQAAGQDNCSSFMDFARSYEIDLDYKASQGFIPELFGNERIASGIYPIGVHRIIFYFTDKCGNTADCDFIFEVKEGKAPNPVCFQGLSFALPSSGSLELWASDFESGSTDNCGTGNLIYSFSADITENNKTFTCADIPNGAFANIPLEIYVTDPYGNQSYCNSSVYITDNQDVCTDSSTASAMVAGAIMSESNIGVEELEMTLENLYDNSVINDMTSGDGSFEFDNLRLFKDYALKPISSGDPLNGVSTLDIVLIQKYILGLIDFDSPNQMIAGDVNQSQSISAADLIELRKMILGMQTDFSNNETWRFIPSDHEFVSNAFPFYFDEEIAIDTLIENKMNTDFVAVKIGDVNGNAVYNAKADTEIRSSQTLALLANDKNFKAGELVEISVNSNAFNKVAGFQFTLDFDTDVLDYAGVTAQKLKIQDSHIGSGYSDRGLLAISWNDLHPISVDATSSLFTLSFIAVADGHLSEVIELNSALTNAEAYNEHLEIMDIDLSFESLENLVTDFELLQNQPNPFEDKTTILVNAPTKAKGYFTVYNMDGKELIYQNIYFKKGTNNINLSKNQLPSSGVFYYKVELNGQSKTKKMIVFN